MATAEPEVGADEARKPTDPLKLYCVIFLLLVGVLAVIYVRKQSSRRAVEESNVTARLWFDEKQPRNAREDRPNDIPNLAFEIEQLVEAYVAAGGEDAGTISEAKMKGFAAQSYMTEYRAGNETRDPKASRGYTTLWRNYEYNEGTLENLLVLAHKIDSSARYRVMEMSWQLKSAKDGNNAPPFHKIGRSSLKVALRTATGKGS